MNIRNNLPSKYYKALKNLKLLNLKGGIWIDAGCGVGAYSIPLATYVDNVIALDTNTSSLEILEKERNINKIKNISIKNKDFNKELKNYNERIDGILFAFSLHFQPDINNVLLNSYEILKEKSGKLVIIEYERHTRVPWVPYPLPEEKMLKLLKENHFNESDRIFKNNRYYILESSNKFEDSFE